MKQYLTVAELAEELQVSRNTAQQLVWSEGFPRIILNPGGERKTIRINRDDLAEWLRNRA